MNDTTIRNARALARVLDTAITIPGTRIRVGLDALLGLIPGAGDVAGAALSSYIVMAAVRSGAPTPVIARMLGNILIDTSVGSIPVLGDLFDVAFKSNKRNAELLEQYSAQPEVAVKRSKLAIALVLLAVAVILIGIVTLSILVARVLWNLATG